MIFGIYCIRFPEYLPCRLKSKRGTTDTSHTHHTSHTHTVVLASYVDEAQKIHHKIREG